MFVCWDIIDVYLGNNELLGKWCWCLEICKKKFDL